MSINLVIVTPERLLHLSNFVVHVRHYMHNIHFKLIPYLFA